jgi:Na+-transporting NADH:ubiquinone oxidoreductase subunit C
MVLVVGAILSVVAISLKPKQNKNIEIEKKRNILNALQVESTAENAEDLFDTFIVDMIAVNSIGEVVPDADVFKTDLKKELLKDKSQAIFPVFIGVLNDGSKKYIIPLSGKGLWGPLWGYISFNEDLNTVFGATFSHKSETPGLGAEISTPLFQSQFVGKQIYNSNNEFVSIHIVKGGAAPDNSNGVDAISGGTITSKGLEEMLLNCISVYEPYFKKQ